MLRFPGQPFALDPSDHPGYVAGKVYLTNPNVIGAAALLPAGDTLYLVPFMADQGSVPWLSLGVRCTVAGSAGALLKFGLWEIDPAAAEPRGLPVAVHNAGVSAEATGNLLGAFPAAFNYQPGKAYAAGLVASAVATLPTLMALPNGSPFLLWMTGRTMGNSPAATATAWTIAQPYANDLAALNLTGGLSFVGGASNPNIFIGT